MNNHNQSEVLPHPDSDSPTLQWALHYAAIGWPVLPIHTPCVDGAGSCSCGREGCESPGKHPRIRDWPSKATSDPDEIHRWWKKWPDANVGVLTCSNRLALDIDPRNGGNESLDQLVEEHGPLAETVEAETGGGGRHYLYASPDGVRVPSKTGLLPGIDVKAEGGFIVVAPSLHESGRTYRWKTGSRPGEVEVAPAPSWLESPTQDARLRNTSPTTPSLRDEQICVGHRDTTLTSLAGTMRRRGMSEEAIRSALLVENQRCVDESGNPAPLDEEDVDRIARSIARYAPAPAGDMGTPSIEEATHISDYLLALILETGDTSQAFKKENLLAASVLRRHSPERWFELQQAMRERRSLTEWKEAVANHSRQEHINRRDSSESAFPSILSTDQQLRDIVDEATKAVRLRNLRERFLYQRHGTLVQLVQRESGYGIEIVTPVGMVGHLTRCADWYIDTPFGEKGAKPDKQAALDMIENPDPDLPQLEKVITAPMFGADASLIHSPGYHSEHAVYYAEEGSVLVQDVPDRPTHEEVEGAISLLVKELLADFPFETPADRAMAVGSLVLPFVRRMITGPTPLHLVEATSPGTGKSLYCSLVSIAVTGQPVQVRSLPSNDEEVRKRITAELATSPQIVLLDNLPQHSRFDSAALSAAVTSVWWTDRLLGMTKMVLFRNDALWFVTANNPMLSMEIARRSVRIRMNSDQDRPWERSDWRHPNIQTWAMQHRAALIRAILILVKNWIAREMPLFQGKLLGSFEHWAQVIGGILKAAGIEGFLKNQEELYEHADVEGEQFREFTAAWWGSSGSTPVTVGKLRELCDEHELLTDALGEGTERSRSTRLGQLLKSQRDRVFGNLRVELVRDLGNKGKSYRLVPANAAKAAHSNAGEGEGDLSSVETNVAPGGSPSQIPAKTKLAECAEPRGTSSGPPSPAKKKTNQGETGLLFPDYESLTPGNVFEVPTGDVTNKATGTYPGEHRPSEGPPGVSQGPAGGGGSPPRQCAVCGSPDFVLDALGRYICADCPSAANSARDEA